MIENCKAFGSLLLECHLVNESASVKSTAVIRAVQIPKFLSPRQSTDFDQGSAILHPQQERNIGSAVSQHPH